LVLWVAKSQYEGIRLYGAVLRARAAMIRFAPCATSSSSPSTWSSRWRSSFAPLASAPSPPSPCYSSTSGSSVIAPGNGRPISLPSIVSSSAWPRCSCVRTGSRSLARWSGRRHCSSCTRPWWDGSTTGSSPPFTQGCAVTGGAITCTSDRATKADFTAMALQRRGRDGSPPRSHRAGLSRGIRPRLQRQDDCASRYRGRRACRDPRLASDRAGEGQRDCTA